MIKVLVLSEAGGSEAELVQITIAVQYTGVVCEWKVYNTGLLGSH